MIAKRNSKRRTKSSGLPQLPGFSWSKLLLLVSLLPLLAGVVLICAWALGLHMWEPASVQISVAIFFLLVGFTISNAAQQKWILSGGWLFLAIGDLLFLSPQLNILYAAIAVSAVGILMVIFELIRRVIQRKKTA